MALYLHCLVGLDRIRCGLCRRGAARPRGNLGGLERRHKGLTCGSVGSALEW
jgi:hypothetical protein